MGALALGCQRPPSAPSDAPAPETDSTVFRQVRSRIDSLSTAQAPTPTQDADAGITRWLFPAPLGSEACAPARLAERTIQLANDADALIALETATYTSGQSVPVWDEAALDQKIHSQCETLVWTIDYHTRVHTCRWYTAGTTPAVGFITPQTVELAFADSLLRAWRIPLDDLPH